MKIHLYRDQGTKHSSQGDKVSIGAIRLLLIPVDANPYISFWEIYGKYKFIKHTVCMALHRIKARSSGGRTVSGLKYK